MVEFTTYYLGWYEIGAIMLWLLSVLTGYYNRATSVEVADINQ